MSIILEYEQIPETFNLKWVLWIVVYNNSNNSNLSQLLPWILSVRYFIIIRKLLWILMLNLSYIKSYYITMCDSIVVRFVITKWMIKLRITSIGRNIYVMRLMILNLIWCKSICHNIVSHTNIEESFYHSFIVNFNIQMHHWDIKKTTRTLKDLWLQGSIPILKTHSHCTENQLWTWKFTDL